MAVASPVMPSHHPDAVVSAREREATLPRAAYFDAAYFTLPQLFSLAHQVHEIFRLRPADMLEIGPGNGFVSNFFRAAGVPVVTADINPALQPDICAPLDEVPRHLNGRRFDLVVCCEVLEHMPWADFPANVATLRDTGERLFLTLPSYPKHFGFGGLLRLPRMAPTPVGLYLPIRQRRPLVPQHFWEIDADRDTRLANVLAVLRGVYATVRTGRFALHPYHRWFVAE